MAFQGLSFPNAPFLSWSSVPSSLASRNAHEPGESSATTQSVLGKRRRLSISSTLFSEERPQKRQKQADTKDVLGAFQIDDTTEDALPSAHNPPWHLNDRYVRKFKQDELVAYVRGSEDEVHSNGDDCPIHPIFHCLSDLTAQIPCLAAALQLATRFLVCRHTLPFFHQLLTYNIYILTPESQYYSRLLTHLPPSPYAETGLPAAEHNLTLRAMMALAPYIAIGFTDDSKMSNKWAYTVRKQKLALITESSIGNLSLPLQTPSSNTTTSPTDLLAQLGFQGTTVELNLSPHFLDVLHPKTNLCPVPAQRQRATFFLAVTLVHELAHAVYMLRFPEELHPILPPSQNHSAMEIQYLASEDHEPFYSTHFLPELGHAWETSIFRSLPNPSSRPTPTYERGGIISSLANSPTFDIGLAWSRWPSSESSLIVARPSAQHGPHYTPVPLSRLTRYTRSGTIRPRPTPRWKTLYPLPDSWITRFLAKEFWEEVNVGQPPSTGSLTTNTTPTGSLNKPPPLSHFTPPRMLGVRCANNEWNIDGEYDPSATDMGVEANWGLGDEGSSLNGGDDEEGVVRAGQKLRWEMWKDDEMEVEEDGSDDA